jgi:FkbM family methyltransferase
MPNQNLSLAILTPAVTWNPPLDATVSAMQLQQYPYRHHYILDTHGETVLEPPTSMDSTSVERMHVRQPLLAIANAIQAFKADVYSWLLPGGRYANADVIDTVMAHFEANNDVDVIYINATYTDIDDHIQQPFQTISTTQHHDLHNSFLTGCYIAPGSVFIRSQVIEKVGIPDGDFEGAMSLEFMLRMLAAGYKWTYLDNVTLEFPTAPDPADTLLYNGNIAGTLHLKVIKNHFDYVPVHWIMRVVEGATCDAAIILPDSEDLATFEPYLEMLADYNGNYYSLQTLRTKDKPVANYTYRLLQSISLEMPATPIDDLGLVGKQTYPRPGDEKRGRHQRRTHDYTAEGQAVAGYYAANDCIWYVNRNWLTRELQRSKEAVAYLQQYRRHDTCVVVGNGPSLNKTDLSLLQHADVLICNNAFLNDELREHATYFTTINHHVARQSSAEINSLKHVVKFFPYWLSGYFRPSPKTFYLDTLIREIVSEDVTDWVNWQSTVSLYNLQLAYSLGYSRVLLIGFDHTYQQPKNSQDGDLIHQQDDDENHFDPRYFKGMVWQAADTSKMEWGYRLIEKLYQQHQREIYNCTVGGKLEVFERRDLSEMLNTEVSSNNAVKSQYIDMLDIPPVNPTPRDTFPRLLVIDFTRIGSKSATGMLKETFLSNYPADHVLQVFMQASDKPSLYFHKDGKVINKIDKATAIKHCLDFKPDCIYFRPTPDKPVLFDFFDSIQMLLGLPYIVHIMDDWMERLRFTDISTYDVLHTRLLRYIREASANLGISQAMTTAFESRYDSTFAPVSNCINPSEWHTSNPKTYRYSRKNPFVIRYMGALAEDMTQRSFLDVAEAVSELAKEIPIRLEVFTLPLWHNKVKPAVHHLKNVYFYPVTTGEAYIQKLMSADAVLIAYNFDPDTIRYVQYSMANKMPECLASGSTVIAYGPTKIATIDYLNSLDVAVCITERDTRQLRETLKNLVIEPEQNRALAQKAREYAFTHLNCEQMTAKFNNFIISSARSHGWQPGITPRSAYDDGYIGIYERDQHAKFDEIAFVEKVLEPYLEDRKTLIDVGAHEGSVSKRFATKHWSVLAFEPDPNNRAQLEKKTVGYSNVQIDVRALSNEVIENVAFYQSRTSTGVSSMLPFMEDHEENAQVQVTTLAIALNEYAITHIDFLKIDAEGYDLRVLEGFPWEELTPTAIVCEFEDSKTTLLGYDMHEMAQYLLDKDYVVLISEWHPIIRYGQRHDWRRLVPYPAHLAGNKAWGNLLAFRQDVWLHRPDRIAKAFIQTQPEKTPKQAKSKQTEQPEQPEKIEVIREEPKPPHSEAKAQVFQATHIQQEETKRSTVQSVQKKLKQKTSTLYSVIRQKLFQSSRRMLIGPAIMTGLLIVYGLTDLPFSQFIAIIAPLPLAIGWARQSAYRAGKSAESYFQSIRLKQNNLQKRIRELEQRIKNLEQQQ